ncbi:MAG: VOC family protein [Alphaproteobacteria bacterium]|nr:VOC family protein [Alphaproteobacteria bacterium]
MNRPVHFEIHASDPEKLVEFYSQVFGWTLNPYMPGEYWLIDTGGNDGPGINGGLAKRRGPAPAADAPVSAFVCSLGVTSLDETLAKALGTGATVALPKMAIPNVGWQAYIKDPDGNILGLHQPDPAAK